MYAACNYTYRNTSHITSSHDLCISSSNCSPCPILSKFNFPLQKRGCDREEVENYVYSSKNLYNDIWLFLCVVVGAFLGFFECFYSILKCLMWFFAKTQSFHFQE